MACLCFIFLAFVVAYQCVDVVNGDVNENGLPNYVHRKSDLLRKLRTLCQNKYKTRILARVNLPGCSVICARGVFAGIFGGGDEIQLRNQEPCSNQGGVCDNGQCVHYA
uniref:Putative secreted protein n=1 Tax=Ixodes ricinus TaxID=34613 RepID=V5HA34_IXORI